MSALQYQENSHEYLIKW